MTKESQKKKTTPAGQCRTPDFVVLQATTDTLNTLQTYSSNVGRGGCEPRKLLFVGPFVLGPTVLSSNHESKESGVMKQAITSKLSS